MLAIIVISPWIYRGYRIYDRFIFISTTSSEHFWRGNNPVASGGGLTKNNKPILEAAGIDFKEKIISLNEIDRRNFFMKEAISFIKSSPFDFIKLTTKKFICFWSFSPQIGIIYPKSWSAIYKILFIIIAFFFLSGMFFVFKNKSMVNLPAIGFLLSFFAMISLAQSFYYVDMRHRITIEPLLMIFSAYGMESIFSNLAKKKDVV
ncbi:MAG: hypothetical protein ABIA97_07055 [Candidatus Omnitrophota bacterium]